MTEELDRKCWDCGEVKDIYAFRMNADKGWRMLRCMACEAKDQPKPVRKTARWRPTPEDDRVIRDLYPRKGLAACRLVIPRATKDQIGRYAREVLGLRYEGEHIAGSPPNVEPGWPVPAHDYTPADIAIREWRTVRPVGAVFAPSLGLRA